MAPNTTGHRDEDAEGSIELCTEVLAIAAQVLKPKGNLVMVHTSLLLCSSTRRLFFIVIALCCRKRLWVPISPCYNERVYHDFKN
jgi:hypothetical protein